jgi:hypothetical protein
VLGLWGFQLYNGSQVNLLLVTDNFNYMRLYGVLWKHKSNYHTITDCPLESKIETSQVTTQCKYISFVSLYRFVYGFGLDRFTIHIFRYFIPLSLGPVSQSLKCLSETQNWLRWRTTIKLMILYFIWVLNQFSFMFT